MRYIVKPSLALSLCIFMALFTGCATGSGSVVYRPVIQPDMTYTAALNDLQSAALSFKIYSTTGPFTPVRAITNIFVNENGKVRWEFKPEPGKPGAVEMSLLTPGLDFAVNDWGPSWKITLPDFMVSGSLPELKKASDNLYFIKNTLENLAEKQNKLLLSFEPIAAEYRSLTVKPEITEEQRRLIVQANASAQKKEFAMAIDLYIKALELDPTSYPEAYFNLALLYEKQCLYTFAITNMKQYLMLVPDSKDARSTRDKIYEWELMIPK
ncbi:MAG: tetratricopeptide repeat protein [Deltaproteobacteria bacterium]|nr:tetratricopeptide repeat protein [Deltaproteobacteria bacterium]